MPVLNVRLVRVLLAVMLMAGGLCATVVAPLAAAQEGPGRFGRSGPPPDAPPGYGEESRRGPPFGRRGDEGAQDARRVPGPAGPGHYQRTGQMSPDERRALRREIHDAGREVYRPGPSHR